MGRHSHGSGLETAGASHVRAASRRSLTLALGLTLGYMVAQIVGGILSQSLALLADAGHMATDGAAILLAILALWVAGRPPSITRTFGFQRTEVLAAFINALSLWAIVGWIMVEAYQRFTDPPEIRVGIMLGVGIGGLLVNLAVAAVLHRPAHDSLNVQGAFLHVIGDLLSSLGVVAAGLVILVFGWNMADPILSVVIGVLILISSGRLLWKASHVLMEGTPAHLNLHQLCQRLEGVEGVTGVHDIHAWSITTGYDALSAHVTADRTGERTSDQVLQNLREIASREFGISHVTIQLEDSSGGCPEDHHVPHPAPEPGAAGP